jgi:hypothetical protein
MSSYRTNNAVCFQYTESSLIFACFETHAERTEYMDEMQTFVVKSVGTCTNHTASKT